MKASEKIIRLASKFEQKLYKYAEEVDSGSLSDIIMKTVQDAIRKYGLQNKLETTLNDKRDAEWDKTQQSITGYLLIGQGGRINAKKSGASWILGPGTGLKVDNRLANTPLGPIITTIYNDFLKTTLLPDIKSTLDSQNENPKWANYNTITNFQMPYETPSVFIEFK